MVSSLARMIWPRSREGEGRPVARRQFRIRVLWHSLAILVIAALLVFVIIWEPNLPLSHSLVR